MHTMVVTAVSFLAMVAVVVLAVVGLVKLARYLGIGRAGAWLSRNAPTGGQVWQGVKSLPWAPLWIMAVVASLTLLIMVVPTCIVIAKEYLAWLNEEEDEQAAIQPTVSSPPPPLTEADLLPKLQITGGPVTVLKEFESRIVGGESPRWGLGLIAPPKVTLEWRVDEKMAPGPPSSGKLYLLDGTKFTGPPTTAQMEKLEWKGSGDTYVYPFQAPCASRVYNSSFGKIQPWRVQTTDCNPRHIIITCGRAWSGTVLRGEGPELVWGQWKVSLATKPASFLVPDSIQWEQMWRALYTELPTGSIITSPVSIPTTERGKRVRVDNAPIDPKIRTATYLIVGIAAKKS